MGNLSNQMLIKFNNYFINKEKTYLIPQSILFLVTKNDDFIRAPNSNHFTYSRLIYYNTDNKEGLMIYFKINKIPILIDFLPFNGFFRFKKLISQAGKLEKDIFVKNSIVSQIYLNLIKKTVNICKNYVNQI